MHATTIALITSGNVEAARREWWDEIVRHWPSCARSHPPRLECVTPESVLSSSKSLKAVQTWDAALVTPAAVAGDVTIYRVLDVLQQAMVPAVMLLSANTPRERLDSFHPGAVFVQAAGVDACTTAATLFALSQRQSTVRSMDQTIRLAQSFQGETAAEIDRLHQELLLAAKVQRDFLPKHMPTMDGVECSVLFRPAGFVSGDTYDVCRLDEDHIGFFLADAMGHGVPAALMTLYISGSLPRKEIGPDGYRIIPPGEALGRLNAELADSIAGPARFATAICGTIDTRSGLITLAAAGHPPPLRIGPHGVRPVNVSGMLLGVVPDFEYQSATIRLEEDEILVIHSDGIETAFSRQADNNDLAARAIPPHMAHFARMRKGVALESLGAAMEQLATDIDSQAGSFHQDDDLTVLSFATTSVRDPFPARAIVDGGGGGRAGVESRLGRAEAAERN